MNVRDGDADPSELETPEAERPPPQLRLNLLRWDSEWLKQRLARVQDNLDRAVEDLEKSTDG
jgi:hypothetical protein